MAVASTTTLLAKEDPETNYYYYTDYNLVDGIYYSFDESTNEAYVTCKQICEREDWFYGHYYWTNLFYMSADYSGNLVIPATVTYEGKEYTVVGLDNGAFCDCEDLISVVLPPTIREIGDVCYDGYNIDDPVRHSNIPLVSMRFTGDTPPEYFCSTEYFASNFMVQVPEESYDAYANAESMKGVRIQQAPSYSGSYSITINDIELPDGATIYISQNYVYDKYGFKLDIPFEGDVTLRFIKKDYANSAVVDLYAPDYSTSTYLSYANVIQSVINDHATISFENSGSYIYNPINVHCTIDRRYDWHANQHTTLRVYPYDDPTKMTTLNIVFDPTDDTDTTWPIPRCEAPEFVYENGKLSCTSSTPGSHVAVSYSLLGTGSSSYYSNGGNINIENERLLVKAVAEATGYAPSDAVHYVVPLVSGPRGDANGDGVVNVGDIENIRQEILATPAK